MNWCYLTLLVLVPLIMGLDMDIQSSVKMTNCLLNWYRWCRVNQRPMPTAAVTLLQPTVVPSRASHAPSAATNVESGQLRCRSSVASMGPYCQRHFCRAHDFEHLYEQQNTRQPHVNRFEATAVGRLAIMRDACLQRSGLPVTRLCTQVDGLAVWSSLSNVTCHKAQGLSNKLLQLHNEMMRMQAQPNATLHWRGLTTELSSLWRQTQPQVLPADVLATQLIFANLADVQQKVAAIGADMLSISASIMSANVTVLRRSAELNATNKILDTLESYMDAVTQQLVPPTRCGQKHLNEGSFNAAAAVETIDYSELGVQALITDNISVFYVNPHCANITGIAIYDQPGVQRMASRHGYWFRFLRANESLPALLQEAQLETASWLPTSLWQTVRNAGARFIVLKVYSSDALFVETAAVLHRRPHGKVLAISLPDFSAALPEPVPFLLRNEHTLQRAGGCGYWNYSTWLNDSVHTSSAQRALMLCQAAHLTQFAFLVGGSYVQQPLSEPLLNAAISMSHERILDNISSLGCGLSLCGLLIIWLTALLFASWRRHASTKLLLNLCLALTLQMLLLLHAGEWSVSLALALNYKHCLQLGAVLQYLVLVVFSWMLIIAYIQYQRYVIVLGAQRPQNFILKAALVAWTLPLLPTLLVVLLDPTAYMPTQRQLASQTALCYPSGHALTYGVVLPICLVTAANVLMVCRIFNSVYRMQHPNRSLIVQQLQLSVLLFFLLGLTWIFGILSFLQLGIIFSYIFCVTATLQGFVIFIYFVLLDAEARRCWLNLLKGQQRKQRQQSSTTNTTFLQANQRSNE